MSCVRFCMLTTFYPPHNFGGDGISIQHLARALVGRGHHVTVVCDADAFEALRHGPVQEPDDDGRDGVEVVRLRSRWARLSTLLTQQTGRPVVNGARIRRILDHGRYDVINFHNVSLIGGPDLLAYGGDAIKIYTAHEHWLVCPTHALWRHNREPCTGRQCLRCTVAYRRPPQLWRYTGLLDRRLDEVDAFIAMSEFSRDKHREFGFSRTMDVVPFFLPDGPSDGQSDAAPPQEHPYFLFVGRLETIKGLDDVIPLFAEISAADLLVAGEGAHSEVLRREARGLANVKFLGRVELQALERYYRHAVALVVPSVGFETFGNVLIEAFRAGTPVIARRFGPFPEIIARSGAGLSFSTATELRGALDRLLADPAERARMATQARKAFAENWSEAVVVPRYLDVARRAALAKGRNALADSLGESSIAGPQPV